VTINVSGISGKQLLIFCCLALSCACTNESSHSNGEWSVYRGDKSGTAHSSLSHIDTTNVQQLKVAWTYHTGDSEERIPIQCNPIIVNGKMYVTSPKLKVIALDPATGKELWKFDPFKDTVASGTNRGVTYWENGNEKRILMTAGPYLHCLNAENGTPVENFGSSGKVDLRAGLDRDPATLFVTATTPGIIYGDIIIQGTMVGEGYDAAPGFVRAYNVRNGETVWTFRTIPQPGEAGYETWLEDSYKKVGGANSWAGMALDEERGIVYVPTGSAAFDFYGANRKGNNLYANCLLALDAATGKLKWYRQLVHHDLWDYDIPAPPNLVTVTHEGKQVDAVAQVTKMGFVFLFDRETGVPLFAIEERPVPQSELPGETTSLTQPTPVKPPAIVRQNFSESEITDISTEANASVREKIKGARMGSIFTPPSTDGVVQFPGTRGGAEWGGAAFDSETGILYVNANEIPMFVRMKRLESSNENVSLADYGQRLYTVNNCTSCHGGDRAGNVSFPSLLNLSKRMNEATVSKLLSTGKGQMPAFPNIQGKDKKALIAFLLDQKESTKTAASVNAAKSDADVRYVHNGWTPLMDANNYPGVKPPWGTLNAIDLNKGEIRWKIPLGEYPELVEKGLPPTGTQNLGGSLVTSGGLLFIAATRDEKFRAFNKRTGKMLWEHKLPAGGYATPATYVVDGKQYIVIAAGGGGKVGSKSGDAYVAFVLDQR
jgi:quinoprotein glucose dehydrogenase